MEAKIQSMNDGSSLAQQMFIRKAATAEAIIFEAKKAGEAATMDGIASGEAS